MSIKQLAMKAREASRKLATLTTEQKNAALKAIIDAIHDEKDFILAANNEDYVLGEEAGLGTMLDRLKLDEKRLAGICGEIESVIGLNDPVGEIMEDRNVPSGLDIQRVRTPIGVIGMIYESRPNVTIDATVLAIKSGNAIVLRGGSDIIHSNKAIVNAIKKGLEKSDVPADAVQLVEDTDRALVKEMLEMKGVIDVIIPRGGRGLINFVSENSMVPVIETGASVVHTYVDAECDVEKAVEILVNAKCRRVSICNTLDTILIHEQAVDKVLGQAFAEGMAKHDVEVRADAKSYEVLAATGYEKLVKAGDDDFGKEFLDYILSIKVVASMDEALDHIYEHSLKHSEAIVSSNSENVERFLNEVDAACVYANASTQFSDGAQFGLGAEIGISTQKLHVRGPFALEGLTSYKWVVRGDGHVRKP